MNGNQMKQVMRMKSSPHFASHVSSQANEMQQEYSVEFGDELCLQNGENGRPRVPDCVSVIGDPTFNPYNRREINAGFSKKSKLTFDRPNSLRHPEKSLGLFSKLHHVNNGNHKRMNIIEDNSKVSKAKRVGSSQLRFDSFTKANVSNELFKPIPPGKEDSLISQQQRKILARISKLEKMSNAFAILNKSNLLTNEQKLIYQTLAHEKSSLESSLNLLIASNVINDPPPNFNSKRNSFCYDDSSSSSNESNFELDPCPPNEVPSNFIETTPDINYILENSSNGMCDHHLVEPGSMQPQDEVSNGMNDALLVASSNETLYSSSTNLDTRRSRPAQVKASSRLAQINKQLETMVPSSSGEYSMLQKEKAELEKKLAFLESERLRQMKRRIQNKHGLSPGKRRYRSKRGGSPKKKCGVDEQA